MSKVAKLVIVAAILLVIALGVNAFFSSDGNDKQVVTEDPGKAAMIKAIREGRTRPGGPPVPVGPSASPQQPSTGQ